MTILSPAMEEAIRLLQGAGTWHELRRSLQDRNLDTALSPAEMQDLLAAWHMHQATRLSDTELTEELLFWARGGTFETHLAGWQALSPEALVEEADNRGWFVRRLPSGAVINPPGRPPLSLKIPSPLTP